MYAQSYTPRSSVLLAMTTYVHLHMYHLLTAHAPLILTNIIVGIHHLNNHALAADVLV